MQLRGSRRAESRESTVAEFRRIFHDRRKRKLHRSLVPLCALPLRTTHRQLFPRIAFSLSFFFPQGRTAERTKSEKTICTLFYMYIYIYIYIYIFPEIFIVLYIPRISFDEHRRRYRREPIRQKERDRERVLDYFVSIFISTRHSAKLRLSPKQRRLQNSKHHRGSLISRRSARYIRPNRPFFLPTCFFLRVPGALRPHFATARRRRRATPLAWIKALFARIDT